MEQYFVTFAITIPTVIAVFEFVKNLLKLQGAVAQVVSWVTAFVIGYGAHFLGFGFWAELQEWYEVLGWAFGVGIVANLGFDAGIIEAILKAVPWKK